MVRSGHVALDPLVDLWPNPPFGDSEIKVGLESKPEIGRNAKILGQPKRGICGDRPFPVDDRADATRRDSDLSIEPIDTDPQRFHEFFQQNLTRMNGIEQLLARHRHTSMVIDNLDLVGITLPPDRANSPPVIDADTVLPLAVSFQRFKTVSRRNLQALQRSRAIRSKLRKRGTFTLSNRASVSSDRKERVIRCQSIPCRVIGQLR